jgi:hypothetical protein
VVSVTSTIQVGAQVDQGVRIRAKPLEPLDRTPGLRTPDLTAVERSLHTGTALTRLHSMVLAAIVADLIQALRTRRDVAATRNKYRQGQGHQSDSSIHPDGLPVAEGKVMLGQRDGVRQD